MKPLAFPLVCLGLAAAAAAQGHWWVSPTGNDADPGTMAQPFLTINHAATVAVAGDVIHLFAATYGNEQGNVVLGTKKLTIVGAGVGATVVKAHTSLDIMLPAGLLATPTIEAHRCALTLQGSATTFVRDLTLDEGFSIPGTGRAYCLWVGTGADAVLDNVECINARANPINGIQGPLGVNIRGDGVGDTTNVTMRNCVVREYGKGGVVANFDARLVMDECRVDGYGHAFLGLAAQNGIQVSRGAICDIRRTTVTDHWYDPATVVATGMLFFDPGPGCVVEDNNVGNCQAGIYVFASAPTATPGTLRRNRVATSSYALTLSDVSGLTVTDNSFSISLSGVADDVWDDLGGNTFSGNWYSSLSAPGTYAIPGGGGTSDTSAKPFSSGFGSSFSTMLPPGYAPIDLVVTDLNGGGGPDFAALCQSATSALAIGLNTGGAFTVSGLPFGTAAGAPVALVAGEFNGLSGRDLAAITVSVPPALTENKIWVFANDGSGGFSLLHTHTIAGATAPNGIAAGDLDGDTIDDLVVADAGAAGLVAGQANAFLNNGTGTAFTAVALVAGYTAACRDAAIGDLDGDTFADVAVIEGDAAKGLVHLFKGDGAGGFTAYPSTPVTVSLNSSRVLAADVEGDGDLDVLVASARDAFGIGEGGVDVLQNTSGAFGKSLYIVDRGPTDLVAGDFDDDADPDTLRRDVAVVNLTAGSITILGGWSDAGAGTGGVAFAGAVVTGLGIGDVDGDGFADLVYCDAASGTVVVQRGAAQARADSYGAGSAGTSGLVPNLYPVGVPSVPTLGNATFGLGLRNVRPFSIAVIGAGTSPAPILPGGLLIADIGATWALVTNVFGQGAVPLPIPVTPALAGFEAYCQAGIFDPEGVDSFFPGFAVTNGLQIRLGS